MQELIKKFFTLFLLIFLVFIFSCNRENKYKTFYIPDEPKDKISLDEMDHDLELMKLFFTDCYIGYYDAVENGFNLDDALEKIRQKTLLKHKNNSSIATKEFYRIICSVLSETLNVYDKHFYISFGDSVFRPKNTKKVFFSDIYLSEYDGKWVVQNNSISEIPKGSIYTGKIENLYQTYEDNVFRYGVCSSSSLSKAAIQIDGENIQVQVHSDNLQYSRPEIKFFETEKTIYISANSWFLDNEQEKEFEKICESLQTNSGKNIIIDVRNNYGGRTVFPEKLIPLI
ncbi:MAG: hypothetical protein HUJ68_00215, partial [Clostridia bacterium]|nr:hypothetical protein [Clostridia bacterium]